MLTMNTDQLNFILKEILNANKVNFLGVFAQDQVPLVDSSFSFPLCFVSNTHPSSKPGEHWVAFYYLSPSSAEFFDSYGMHPSLYGFSLAPMHMNHRSLQSLSSNVCGQYCIYYLYHRSRGKTLAQIVSSFSSHDQAWNDNSVARFVCKHFPRHHTNQSHSFQSCLKRLLCNK